MRIGYYFEASTKSGGAYQYALNMINCLKEITEYEYYAFNISPDFPYHEVKLPNWHVIDLIPVAKKQAEVKVPATQNITADLSFRRQFNLFVLESLRKLKLYGLENFLTTLNARKRAGKFKNYDIDLMIFHGPSLLSFLTDIPGIVPVHDIEHRLHKGEFPELSEGGQFARREFIMKHIAKKAFRIFVDSLGSKEDVTKEYKIAPERIKVVPFVPPMYLKKDLSKSEITAVKNKYELPDNFLYYPANLWPHKNHMGILKALALLKAKKLQVNMVFTGSLQDLWGEGAKMKKFIAENGLEKQVRFLGYVDANEISALYLSAEAMIMPVLMGPTYIPVYEAWHMGCPVLYSDIRGPRDQAGDAALLLNPHDPADIAEKIKMIWKNETLKKELAEKGRRRLSDWTHDDFRNSIRNTINEFEKRGQQ